MNQKCPSCGNYVEGKKKATIGRKMTRGAVKKGATMATGAAIGSIIPGIGTAVGAAVGFIASEFLNDAADEMYDAAVDEIEFEFICPKCGRKWTRKINSNQQNQSNASRRNSNNNSNRNSSSHSDTYTQPATPRYDNTNWQEKFNKEFDSYLETTDKILSSKDAVKQYINDLKYKFGACNDNVICSEFHFLRAFACLQYSLNNSDDNSLVLLGQNLISTAINCLADEEYRLVSLLFEILAVDTKTSNALNKIKKLQLRCPDIPAMENTLFKTEYWQNVYEEACYNKLLDVAIYNEEQNKEGAVIDALQRISELADIGYKLFAYSFLSKKYVEIDPAKSFDFARKATAIANFEEEYNSEIPMHRNWLDCVNMLGYCYEEGAGIGVNYEKAFELFQKCAKLELPLGMANLAECYELGHGVSKDIKTALEWYEKAALAGVDSAKAKLEELKNNQENWKVVFAEDINYYFENLNIILKSKENINKFLADLKSKIEKCQDDTICSQYYFLSAFVCLEYSINNWENDLFEQGVNYVNLAVSILDDEEYKLLKTILEICRVTPENKNSINVIESLINDAPIIENMQDVVIKTAYWREIYEQVLFRKIYVDCSSYLYEHNDIYNNIRALSIYDFLDIDYKIPVLKAIGDAYEEMGNYSKYFEYEKSVVELVDFENDFNTQDSTHTDWLDSLENIAYCYSEGVGVPKDTVKALEIYTKCAKLGSDIAMRNIGEIYEDGEVVEQNYETALLWYKKAIDAGYDDAQEDIDRVKTLMVGFNSKDINTTAENEYLEELKACLEEDGEISQKERRLLERFRKKLEISDERAKELEESLSTPQLTDAEKEYLEEYKACIEEDSDISPKERRLLNRIRESLGISEERANEIEKL